MYSILYPDFHHQLNRWGKLSFEDWEVSVQSLKQYLSLRPGILRTYIKEYFELDSMYKVKLKVNDTDAGKIKINSLSLSVPDTGWTGLYYTNIPVNIEAIPNPGYKFTGWKNLTGPLEKINLALTSDTILEALFEPVSIDPDRIVINEINYHSKQEYDEVDWIEIVNLSGMSYNLLNWKLNIESTSFELPDISTNHGDYLIICNDKNKLKSSLNKNTKIVELSGFEINPISTNIALYNESDILIDQVTYCNNGLWSSLADGKGFTLELKNPYFDNSQPENWRASMALSGSPGNINANKTNSYTGLLINECMASNSNTIHDEFGEYDDWIELYNSGYNTIDLRGLLVTDNSDTPVKYQIPYDYEEEQSINPGGFMLLWTDGDDEQGPLHTNFRLSATGEEIEILTNTGFELVSLDHIEYEIQSDLYTYGRTIDGLNEWNTLIPTPNESNHGIQASIPNNISGITGRVIIYPNPARTHVTIKVTGIPTDFPKELTIQFYDITGRLMQQEPTLYNNNLKVDLQNLKPGIYVLKIYSINEILATRQISILR